MMNGDLIPDGKEIEINGDGNISIKTNPLVYNDFNLSKTEIRQGIERDALSVSSDGMVSIIVDYEADSTEKPQIQKISDYTYQISSSISEGLRAEIRMKLSDEMIQELQSDPYKYRMYYLDTEENSWKMLRHTDIDLDNGYIWGLTEHFSEFSIKDTATKDSDGDGLSDEYEMSTEYTVSYDNCEGEVTWGQKSEGYGYEPVIRWTQDSYKGSSSWKMGDETGPYYMYSPALNINMDEKSHASISFYYKYSNPTGEACYSLYFLAGGSKIYPGEEVMEDGEWHFFKEDIYSKITEKSIYSQVPVSTIPLNEVYMEFDTPNTADYILIDEIKITGYTDLNNPDTDGDGLSDGEEVNGEITRYAVDMNERGYLFFRDYPSDYSGHIIRTFTYHTNPLSPDTDMDGQNDYHDLVPLDYDMDGDGYLNYGLTTNPSSGCYVERLAEPINSDPNLIKDANGIFIPDDDTDNDGIPNYGDKDMDADGMKDVYEAKYGDIETVVVDADGEWGTNEVNGEGWQNPYIYNARYAILIGGGDIKKTSKGDIASGGNLPAFWKDTKKMYLNLVNSYRYLDENVYLHFWDHKKGYKDGIHIDGPADWHVYSIYQEEWGIGIKDSLIELRSKMTKNDLFIFFVNSHGGTDECGGYFQAYDMGAKWKRYIYYNYSGNLSAKERSLAQQIDNLTYARAILIFSACYSGTAIKGGCEHPEWNLTGENRIIITNTDKNELGWPEVDSNGEHIAFLFEGCISTFLGSPEYHPGFLKNMGGINLPKSMKYAYDKGYDAATHNRRRSLTGVVTFESTPQIFNPEMAENTYW